MVFRKIFDRIKNHQKKLNDKQQKLVVFVLSVLSFRLFVAFELFAVLAVAV